MTEKTCQTMPLDCDNLRTKCPCCGSLLKLVLTSKSEGLQFELLPVPVVHQKDSAISPHCNNSLMNIVSVSSSENRLKDQMPPGKLFLPQQQGDPLTHNPHNNAINCEDDSNDANINHSNSSSLSTNSVSHNLSSGSCQSQFNSSSAMQQPFRKQQQEPQQSHLTISRSLAVEALKSEQADVPHNYDLFRHQVIQSSTPETKFKCEISQCGLSFANSQQLELHYKEHKGEKIQKCDWPDCNRLFSSKEKLRNHIRCRHTGERPYQCGDCDKAFTSPKHLKDHRLLHTDERPFACDWEGCDLRFRRRHHLVAHKRVHTKERPYNCQYPGCEMKFTKSHHVKRHYETHFKYRGSDQTPAAAAAVLLSSAAASLTAPAAVSPAAACSPLSSALIGSYAFPAV